MVLLLLSKCVAICILLYLLGKRFMIKSPLDNIPGPVAGSFLYGNLRQLLDRKGGWSYIEYLTNAYDGIVKLQGPLGAPMLYVFDPTALHNVIVKDQQIFEEAAWFLGTMRVMLGPGLLSTLGEQHRRQRKLLNPVFSGAHMRRIVPIFNEVGRKLQTALERSVAGHAEAVEVDMMAWMTRTALELVGQAGLGYSFDPLVAERKDEFATAISGFQPILLETTLLRRGLPYIPDFIPSWLLEKAAGFVPYWKIRKMKHIADVLYRRSAEIFEEKRRALEQGDETVSRQVGEGKDLMSVLLRANLAGSDDDRLPEDELISQMSTFILAAMDTTSTALAATLELLAKHPDVQEKLRNEILEAMKGDSDLDYDALGSLPYLDAVCRETLRLYPPIANMFRETRIDVSLPLSKPITGVDGTEMSEIAIPKNTTVIVGILSSNCNKAVWGEDGMEWKPERWLGPLPDTVLDAKIPGIYANLLTFLGGGRACIGFKFSQLEMKVVLCILLSKFTFAPSGRDVVWNLSGINFPTVDWEKKPSMPLRVGMYEAGASP